MSCATIENPMIDFGELVRSVNNPEGQPMQDIQIETSARSDGGQVGGPGQAGGNDGGSGGNGGNNGGNGGNGRSNGGSGQGQIAPNNPGGAQEAIGAAAETVCVSVWGAIVVSTTAVLFTAAVW